MLSAIRPFEEEEWTIETWFKDVYLSKLRIAKEAGFCENTADVFGEKDLEEICRLMKKLMKFEPGERAEAR